MRLLHSIALIALLTQYGCIENCTEPNPWATDVLEMTVPDLTEPDMAEPSADLRVPRCNANSDCPLSGLCLDTQYFSGFVERPGDCVKADRITYVDIASTSAMPDGTTSSPFHTIAEALQAVLAAGRHLVEDKPYVLVAGSSMPYKDKISVKLPDSAEVVLIGPWADPALTPRRPAKTDELVYWAKNSRAPAIVNAPLLIDGGSVWIDGLSFRGEATGSGIECINSKRLSIQRTKIESYKYGVSHESATGNYCSYIFINRSSISNNKAAGVYVTDSFRSTNVTISNSCISKNSDSGIVATRVMGLQVVHSTIAANGKTNMPFGAIRFTPGLLKCSICGSLLAGNSSSPADMGSGQQNCQDINMDKHPNKEVSKISDGGLEFNSDFLLFDPDSAPMSKNYDFIDKIIGTPCVSNSLDYVGTNRPKGQNEDYGMHEVWWNNPSDGGLP